MKARIQVWLVCMGLAVGPVGAVESNNLETLFRASEAGAGAWVDGAACVTENQAGHIVIKECDKGFGDAFIQDRFAYEKEGIVKVNVHDVLKGRYTVQVLFFEGDQHVGTKDLVKKSKRTGEKDYELRRAQAPHRTDSIMFKVWVEGSKNAAVELSELSYLAPAIP